MLEKFLLYTTSLLFIGLIGHTQEISSLEYSGNVVIPHGYKVDGSTVGGLSAITLNTSDNFYYLVADKPPSRLFKAEISTGLIPDISLYEALELTPSLLSQSELEGIAYDHKNNKFFVSDEQKNGTRIIELDTKAEFQRVVEPINQPFLPLSGHNSGIEGLTISNDLKYLFYAFERPEEECLENQFVKITKRKIIGTDNNQVFYYKLHSVENDKLNSNGISEILYISEDRLLVLERAYIPGEGNIVKLYQVLIEDKNYLDKDISCLDDSVLPLRAQLLFDFASIAEFEIDNAEGMTFNYDKSVLYIVTDNNFSKRQQTQIISLDVNWN